MNKLKLKIAAFHFPPAIYLNQSEDEKWHIVDGIDYELLKALQEKFGFSYEVLVPKIQEWGKLKNGYWTGVIGMVERADADIGLSLLMQTYDRYKAVGLTVPYIQDSWSITSKTPEVEENTNGVIKPFQNEVWCWILNAIMATTLTLYLLQAIQAKMHGMSQWSLPEALWNVVAVLCQADGSLSTLRSSASGFCLLWIMSASILQFSYGGTLIGFLTFPEYEPTVNSFAELNEAIKNRNYGVCVLKNSIIVSELEYNRKSFGVILEVLRKNPDDFLPNTDAALVRVLTEKRVYLGSRLNAEMEASFYGSHNFHFATVFFENYITVATSRRFRYLKEMNLMIRRLSEMGFPRKWKWNIINKPKEEFARKNPEGHEDTTTEKPLSLSNLKGVFYLFVTGNTFATVVFFIEAIVGSTSRNKRVTQ